MARLFGTDGVRGKANADLTALLAYELGRAGAYVLTTLHHRPTILVAKDTRRSGDMLEAALVAGMCSVGANVATVGVLPTPAVAYLTRSLSMDAGVMISASHNPFDDNGIKFFSSSGYKLSDALEDKIETIIRDQTVLPSPLGEGVGHRIDCPGAREKYIEKLVSCAQVPFRGLSVVLDCANGAASGIAGEVFSRLGAQVISLYDRPDGENINRDCGSTHIEALCREVKARGGVGFAFDGDADRMIAVDEKGEAVDGDFVMAILGAALKKEGKLANNAVVGTVMSNLGLTAALKSEGIDFLRTSVGDRYVLEKMLSDGYCLGGEASGHVIFLEHNTTGDGILTAVMVASAMVRQGKKLCELRGCMSKYPQVLRNVRVDAGRKNFEDYPPVMEEIERAQQRLGSNGRVLVRVSGTEPLIRIMVEGQEENLVMSCAQDIETAVKQCLCS